MISTVRILLPIKNNDGLELQRPVLPDALIYGGDFTVSPVSIIQKKEGGYAVNIPIIAKQAGRYVLPSFRFFYKGTEYYSDPDLYEVLLRASSEKVLPSLRWSGAKEIYAGQSTLYILEIYLSKSYQFPHAISVHPPSIGVFEELFGIGSMKTQTIGDTVLYIIPVASFLYTPTSTGSVVIPKSIVELDAGQVASTPFLMTVLQSPEEISRSGAVGNFTYRYSVHPSRGTLTDQIIVEITLEGQGNLPLVNIPVPRIDSYSSRNKTEESDISIKEDGYTGYRKIIYHYLFSKPGTYTIVIPPLFAFLPRTQHVYRLEGHQYKIVIQASTDNIAKKEESSTGFLIESKELEILQSTHMFEDIRIWLLFLVIPFVVLVFFLYDKRKTSMFMIFVLVLVVFTSKVYAGFTDETAQVIDLFEQNKIESALATAEEAISRQKENAVLHHLLSLIYTKNANIAKAIFHARVALRLNTNSLYLRRALAYVERRFSLPPQFPIPHTPHPDLLFFLIVGVWNFAVLGSYFLYRYHRHAAAVIFMFSSLLAFSVLIGIFIFSVNVAHKVDAIVDVSDLSMQKIPEKDASPWISLSRGTVVRVENEYHGFYQVETDHGEVGWVLQSSLLYKK